MSLSDLTEKLASRQSLTSVQATEAMETMMSGTASRDEMKSFLLAMNNKGASVDEIVGFAQCMRQHAVKVTCGRTPLVDTCGTGGDGAHTFNVSTAAAFIAAGAGVNIAKHGNRAMSSACGSADVLEELGVNINIPAERIGQCIDEVGIGFMFAQAMHPSMKHVAPVRRELGVRTVFNFLGPLTNPASATRQVMGVPEPRMLHLLAGALGRLGCEHALIVHGEGGVDEISLVGETRLVETRNGQVSSWSTSPEDMGLARCIAEDLRGGDKEENARIIRKILSGEPGPRSDFALLNAAAAIAVSGICDFGPEAIERARESVMSGEAAKKRDALIHFTSKGK